VYEHFLLLEFHGIAKNIVRLFFYDEHLEIVFKIFFRENVSFRVASKPFIG